VDLIVDNKNKVLVFWNAKCGCSFVKALFLQSREIPLPEFEQLHEIIGYGYSPNQEFSFIDTNDLERYSSYKKVLIVRDPYKRLVSGFLEKIPKWIKAGHFNQSCYLSFNDFISKISEINGVVSCGSSSFYDIKHFIPQFSEKYEIFEKMGWTFDYVIDVSQLSKNIDVFENLFSSKLDEVAAFEIGSSHQVKYSDSIREGSADVPLEEWMNTNVFPNYKSFYMNEQVMQSFNHLYSNDLLKLKELGFEYSL